MAHGLLPSRTSLIVKFEGEVELTEDVRAQVAQKRGYDKHYEEHHQLFRAQ